MCARATIHSGPAFPTTLSTPSAWEVADLLILLILQSCLDKTRFKEQYDHGDMISVSCINSHMFWICQDIKYHVVYHVQMRTKKDCRQLLTGKYLKKKDRNRKHRQYHKSQGECWFRCLHFSDILNKATSISYRPHISPYGDHWGLGQLSSFFGNKLINHEAQNIKISLFISFHVICPQSATRKWISQSEIY